MTRATMHRQPPEGRTLVEVVAALVTGSILLGSIAVILDMQMRVAAGVRRTALEADGVRTAAAVLAAEMRYATPGDVRSIAVESLAIRIVRGVVYPCAPGVAAYDGMRRPAAGKDSVVGALSGVVSAVTAVADAEPPAPPHGAACAAAALPLVVLSAEPPLDESEPALVFESGAYHVAAGALRYRIGAEGRQPLTEEWLARSGSGFDPGDGGAASLRLIAASRPRSAPPPPIDVRLPSLNRTPEE